MDGLALLLRRRSRRRRLVKCKYNNKGCAWGTGERKRVIAFASTNPRARAYEYIFMNAELVCEQQTARGTVFNFTGKKGELCDIRFKSNLNEQVNQQLTTTRH